MKRMIITATAIVALTFGAIAGGAVKAPAPAQAAAPAPVLAPLDWEYGGGYGGGGGGFYCYFGWC